VLRDGADNWFLQAYGARGSMRARLVTETVITREAFGGPVGDPLWTDLPFVPPLPDNVARDAAVVRAAIGVSRRERPRAVIARLVEYFRSFVDSDDPPRGHRNVYLDLALSKKGVCRHRSFAFLVTAQSLGIPARMVLNEAHAWVEIHDGALWRRIDLGGAGRMTVSDSESAERPVYQPPPDPFAWPRNSERGDDMVAEARSRAGGDARSGAGAGAGSGGPDDPSARTRAVPAPSGSVSADAPWSSAAPSPSASRDDRPPSLLTIAVGGLDAHCGQPLRVRGEVRADGEPCSHVAVELWLRAADPPEARPGGRQAFLLGTLATGDDGAFAGSIVVPTTAPVGDYDVFARTQGDMRCGAGSSE
jgi:hypothetical protein